MSRPPRSHAVLLLAGAWISVASAAGQDQPAPLLGWRQFFQELLKPQAAPNVPREGARSGSDAAFLESILVNATSTDPMRRGAAERLVREGSPEAMGALERALRSAEMGIASAALAAVDRAAIGVPQLADALLALATSPIDVDRAAVARTLIAANPAAAAALAAVALDARAAFAVRSGAIATLGEMRSRDATQSLVELLSPDRNESPDLLRRVCSALERSTGLAFGTDQAAWRRWWADSANLVAESSSDAELRALASRVEGAERALGEERRRADRLSERLVEVYGQLFLSLTQRDRMVRAAGLLSDELAAVRSFALGQIQRALRNGQKADETTRRGVVVLLDDPVPTLRVGGVRLLDDLGVEDLAARIVERLPNERDAEVVAAYLAVLANRPDPAAFVAMLPLLRDAVLGEAACRVLNKMVERGATPSEWKDQVLPALRETLAARPNGQAAQLLAVAGDDGDVQRVIGLLDSTDASVKRGAAEGLRRRGVRRPLLERAGDPAIYGPLVAAIAEDAKTLETIRSLVAIPPPPDMVVEWNSAVAKVLRDLPVADLVEADTLLADVAACDAATRLTGLARVVNASRAGLSADRARRGLSRYVDLLTRQGRASELLNQLEQLEPRADEPIFDALFRARVLAGDFRKAAQLRPEPGPWLELLASVVGDPLLARPVADEIALRFGGRLVGDDQATFERLRRSLPAVPASVTVPGQR